MTNTVGYQIQATDPDGDAIASYGATALPTGLSAASSSGLITESPTAAGSYNATISATDSGGAIGSTSFTWKVATCDPGALDIPVATGADDAEERSTGGMRLASSDLDMMIDGTTVQQAVGLRFTGVPVPPGAKVRSAYVLFQADEAHSDATTLTIMARRLPMPHRSPAPSSTSRTG